MPSVDQQLKTRLMNFFALDRRIITDEYDSWLYSYYRKLFTKPREALGFLGWCDRLANLCDAEGGECLDAGCGFGITCFGFAASSCAPRGITGLDPSEGKIDTMKKIAASLGVGEDTVKPVLGDAMALQFPDASFDAVFVKDVASHVRERPLFFSEISRVLKPGGKFLLTDENNGLDIIGSGARSRLWLRNEAGPLPEGSWMSQPYREQRRAFVGEWRPDLPADTIEKLADESMGMWGDELKTAIENFNTGDEFINTTDFPYRHPVSGEYMEYPFNPLRLAKELRTHGFNKAKLIRPMFATGHPLKKALAAIISALHPLSIIVQPSFYILAEK